MREFYFKYLCTTPPYDEAACAAQYSLMGPVFVASLALIAIAVVTAVVYWRKGWLG